MRRWLANLRAWLKHPLSGPPPTPLVEWIRRRDDARLEKLLERMGATHKLIEALEEEVRAHSNDDAKVQSEIIGKLGRLDNHVLLLRDWLKENTQAGNQTATNIARELDLLEDRLRKEFGAQVRALQHRTEVAHMRIDRIEPDE